MLNSFFADITNALALIGTWEGLLAIAFGVIVGQWVGAIPGLTSSMAIALLIPVSFYLPPWVAISMLIGVYKGGLFADSSAAILIKTPGMPAAAAAMLDGYPLNEQGKAGKALRVSLLSSVIGDTMSDIVLILFTGVLAALALRFGPPEFHSVFLCAFFLVGAGLLLAELVEIYDVGHSPRSPGTIRHDITVAHIAPAPVGVSAASPTAAAWHATVSA